MKPEPDRYIPALTFRLLTPFFDPLLRLLMREGAIKRRLIQNSDLAPGHRVVDLGCGTGTLAILAKRLQPGIQIVGLDADPKVLSIAEEKSTRAGVEVRWDRGLAFDLPYLDQSYDRVLSSLMFHHLDRSNKRRAFKEAFRILVRGGEVHVMDIARPHNWLMAIISGLLGRLEHADDNVRGLLPQMMEDSGFVAVHESGRFSTAFGTVSILSGNRP